jgi:hypothetical protein
MSPALPLAPVREAPEPTHNCIRCGRPGVPAENALCELCNPLELAQPSATQLHGIAALGIIVFVVILAVLGRAALSGTGPFVGTVTEVAPSSGGLTVSVRVENQGTKAAATTCRIVGAGNPAGGPGELVQTPLIAPKSSVQFSAVIVKLGATAIPLDVDCQSP